MLKCFIMFSMIVPFSLILTLDVLKILQTYWIENDKRMFLLLGNIQLKCAAMCMNKTMHEDLGRVKMVFTDKTGTLTDN